MSDGNYKLKTTKSGINYEHSEEHKIVVLDFNSAEDYIESCLAETKRTGEDPHHIWDEDWTYGSLKNRENLVEHLMVGKASDKVTKFFEKYRAEVERKLDVSSYVGVGLSSKRTRRRSDDGDELNIDRIMTNRDDYWDTMVRDNRRRNIRIGINFTLNADNDEMEFARLGATASVLADVLTKMGNAVEICATYCCRYRGRMDKVHEFMVLFPIKRSNEPLDLQRVMSIATNGILRDLLFQMKEQFQFGSGMGQQKEMSDNAKKKANVFYVVEQKDTSTTDNSVDALDREIRRLSENFDYEGQDYNRNNFK
tara:strand:- start:14080 stop:15009 length:930 start_codon:yes stop_codon:yes gene_type:complete